MQKEEIKKIIDEMPENSTLEDLQYTLYVRSKIQKGLEAAEKGDVLTQDKMEKRMEKWLEQ
jgi:predicted transcriptional regulator